MASKLAYENESFIRNVVSKRWKMHFVEFFNCWNNYLEKTSTQAFIFCDKPVDARLVVVSFRGTGPFDADEWITEFDLELHQMGSLGKVHVGFLEAMGLDGRSNKQILRKGLVHDHDNAELPDEYVLEDEKNPLAYYSIREKLKTLLEEHKDAKFLVTGHNLGGALAILFPAILLWHKKTELLEKLLAVHTFGQPRVGDTKFGDFMNMSLNKPVTRYLRMVYCNDMIARIPYDDEALSFKHCGLCLYYNSFYKQKDADGSVPFFWGTAADGCLVLSDDPHVLKEGCGKSFAPFPRGCFFSTSGGLQSFEHPLNKLMPMPRVDSKGQMCGANFKVDVFAKRQSSMPRVGSEANWAKEF